MPPGPRSEPRETAILDNCQRAEAVHPISAVPIRKPEVILAAILFVLPVILVFLVAQRFVRSGTLSGVEKG